MPYSSLPTELRELLRATNAVGLPAILLSPHLAEGTVVFDPPEGQLSVSGDFFPGTIKVNISAIERCQLLLAESKVVLNVIMFPVRVESSNLERFHFQLVDWKSMEQISRLHQKTGSAPKVGKTGAGCE